MRSMFATFALSASVFAVATPAMAQDAPPTAPAAAAEATAEEAPGDVIIVTGTRLSNRTLAESPVPVDVIGADALATSGLGETNKILNKLVPSFNFPQPSINDGTDVIRPATLRGLSPDQTLVLVNGKRRHVTALLNVNGSVGRGAAAVDLNSIPALAIERIEVLRDGASSQYGSDAIAGVINVQLRKNATGGKAQLSYGKYLTQLEDVREVQGLALNAAGQPVLNPADTRVFSVLGNKEATRNDGDQWTFGANLGLPIGTDGYVNITGEYRDRDLTNRAGFDIRPNYNRPGVAFDARELTFNRINHQVGDPATEDYAVFVNAAVPVGTLELYGFGSYSHRDGRSAAFYRLSQQANNRDFSVLTPSTTPTAANFVPLRPDGFLPNIVTDLDDYSAALGLRGEMAGWNTDLSVVYGRNTFDYRTENSLNTSYGPASPTNFDSGGLRFSQITANFDVSKEFEVGLYKPLNIALGAEYRDENFGIRPGQLESYAAGPFFQSARVTTAANCAALGGVFAAATSNCTFPGRAALVGAQGFPGFPASARTAASRQSAAGYVELDTEPMQGLTLTAAGRYEKFSDFGDTLNGKLAARLEVTDGFSLRGSISNGFRAPSLHQQFFTTTSTNFIAGVPVDIVTAPVNSPVARALGSRPLKAEKSVNLSLGVTANPFRAFSITADYYQIKIDDRIVLTENLGASGSGTTAQNTAVAAVLAANGFSSVGAARFFINGLDTTTKGVDVVGAYRWNGGETWGNWSLSAAYNYNKNSIDRRLNALGPLATIPNLALFGRIEGLRFTKGQPKDKIVLSADGSWDSGIALSARTTRYGRVIAPDAAAPLADPTSLTLLGPDDLVLKPKWITDFSVSYSYNEMVTLTVGADNAFDVYPTPRPRGARPASIGGVYPVAAYYIPYSTFSPFGFNGRFVYGRVSVNF